ncbi:hypothetical protein ACFQ3S_12845 [Mucilaginibacter terrae]|uniref:hypothetical protein n=1 Tax=Mucilaginibacter terrae TaxID=1955052 RepID=UPI003629AAF2
MKTYKSLISGLLLTGALFLAFNVNAAPFQDKMSKMKKDSMEMKKKEMKKMDKMKMDKKKMDKKKMKKDTSKMGKM